MASSPSGPSSITNSCTASAYVRQPAQSLVRATDRFSGTATSASPVTSDAEVDPAHQDHKPQVAPVL